MELVSAQAPGILWWPDRVTPECDLLLYWCATLIVHGLLHVQLLKSYQPNFTKFGISM